MHEPVGAFHTQTVTHEIVWRPHEDPFPRTGRSTLTAPRFMKNLLCSDLQTLAAAHKPQALSSLKTCFLSSRASVEGHMLGALGSFSPLPTRPLEVVSCLLSFHVFLTLRCLAKDLIEVWQHHFPYFYWRRSISAYP